MQVHSDDSLRTLEQAAWAGSPHAGRALVRLLTPSQETYTRMCGRGAASTGAVSELALYRIRPITVQELQVQLSPARPLTRQMEAVQGLSLLRDYSAIESPVVRRHLAELLRSLPPSRLPAND